MSPRGVGLERQLCCLLLATSDVEVEKEKEEGMLGDAYLKGDSISLKAGNIFENNPLMCWTGSITLLIVINLKMLLTWNSQKRVIVNI